MKKKSLKQCLDFFECTNKETFFIKVYFEDGDPSVELLVSNDYINRSDLNGIFEYEVLSISKFKDPSGIELMLFNIFKKTN